MAFHLCAAVAAAGDFPLIRRSFYSEPFIRISAEMTIIQCNVTQL